MLSMSWRDCLVTKFYCFLTLEKHLRIVFHFMMTASKFSVTSFKVLVGFFFLVDTDCQNNGCGLSKTAAYT